MSKKYFKKTLAGVFAVAIVASAVPLAPFAPLLDSISITASAADYFYFDVNDDGTLTITGYNGTGGDVVIPSTIDGASVTSIGASAFIYCDNLSKVSIPASVTSIGEYTFCQCTELSEVTIPDSVTNIGEGAFSLCESLSEVTIPDSVTNIGVSAFEECHSLTSVTIGNSVTSIGEWAFYSCGCLTEITIPDSVTSIGANAFEGCLELENVYYTGSESDWESVSIENGNDALKDATITYVKAAQKILDSELTYEIDEEGVLTISGDDTALPAFLDSEWNMTEWCGDRSKIKKVVFNTPNLTSIGRGAFYEFENLESIELPNSLTMIGDAAFECCTSLEKIEFPNTLKEIGPCAFYYCEALSSIKLPENITSIPEAAFACTAIESCTIPAGITEIGDFAFDECPNLKAINVEADNSNYCSVDGVLFNKDKTTLIQYPTGKADAAYIVPDTVSSISESAFFYVEALTDITLPDSLTKIEDDAFGGTSIKSITIPDSVTSIGVYAFEECTSLTEITLSNSLTTIGDFAFDDCSSLTGITIPASVTSVGYGVFKDSGLKSATFECDDADAIANFNPDEGRYIFNGCTDLETIYVPVGCVDAYKNSDGYKAALDDYIDLIQEMPIAAKGYSVAYNGDVTINFHYSVSDSYKNGYVKFNGSDEKVYLTDEKDEKGYYILPISMPAKNMYDEITAQFYDANDEAVGDAVTFDLVTYMDKVKAYDPNCSDFVDSFLEYGAQAANYFNVSSAPTAKKYTDSDYNAVITALTDYENADMDDTFVGATLLLKSTPKLRLYYSETFTGAEQNELNPNLFYTEKKISPVKFGTEDLNGYYVYNYIYKAMKSDDSGLKALCASLYNMSKAIPAVG